MRSGNINVRFDMYYGPFVAGEYEARFVNSKGIATSKSCAFAVTPIVKFRDVVQRVIHGKFIVCYFNIDERFWTPYDVVELWKVDDDSGKAKRATWRYANHSRRANRMFSIPTKKMALGHYQWRYYSAHFSGVRCVSDTFEVYREIVVMTEEQIIFAKAVKLQNIIRMRLARKRVRAHAEEVKVEESRRAEKLERLRKEYKR